MIKKGGNPLETRGVSKEKRESYKKGMRAFLKGGLRRLKLTFTYYLSLQQNQIIKPNAVLLTRSAIL